MSGLLDFAGGAAASAAQGITNYQERQQRFDLAAMMADLEERKYAARKLWDEAQSAEKAKKVTAEAQTVATNRAAKGLINDSENMEGPMPDGSALAESDGNKAMLEEAKQNVNAEPTLRDRVQAKVNLGQTDETDLLKLDAEERKTKALEDNTKLGNRRLDSLEAATKSNADYKVGRLEIDRERLGIDRDKLTAWIEKTGASKEQTTAMIRDYEYLLKSGKSRDEVERLLFTAKAPAPSYKEKTSIDPLTGDKKVETTVTGPGRSPSEKPAAKDSPYKEGQVLRDASGNLYVVKNGKPVRK